MYLHPYTGLVPGLRPADERRRYFVKTFLIGWVQTYSQPSYITVDHSSLSSPLCMFFHYTKIPSCWRNCNLEMHRTKITSDAVRAKCFVKMIFLFQCCNYSYFTHHSFYRWGLHHVNAHISCFCFYSMKNTPHVGNILLISNHIPSTILLRVTHHPVMRHSYYAHLQMPTCQNKPPGYTTSQELCTWFFGSHDDVIKWRNFRVIGPLCGEFTGHRWIPLTKASDAERWYFLWSAPFLWFGTDWYYSYLSGLFHCHTGPVKQLGGYQ